MVQCPRITSKLNHDLQQLSQKNNLSQKTKQVDPTAAPGTGTCARGGLSYREIHYICEELALTGRLVSMDLVEVLVWHHTRNLDIID